MNWTNEFKFRQYYKEVQNDIYGCQKFLIQWLQKKKGVGGNVYKN